MKISVVIATYNGEKFILEQLDSIRLQTKSVDEVIISDDNSTDGTVKIVTDYIQKYGLSENWHLYVNSTNLGYGDNFHKASLSATGELVFFADQDDIWLLDKVAIMSDLMEANPEWTVLSTDHERFATDGFEYTTPKEILKRMPNNGSIKKLALNRKDYYIGALGCCMAVRKDFLDKIQQYHIKDWAHDDRFWKLGICSEHSYLLHRNLVKHRIHGNNVATNIKYHNRKKRSAHFKNENRVAQQVEKYLMVNCPRKDYLKFIKNYRQMMRLRVELLENKRVINGLFLVVFLKYYQKKISWLVDIYITLGDR